MALDDLRLESDRRLALVLLSVVLVPAAWFTVSDATEPGGVLRAWPPAASVIVIGIGLWAVARSRTRARYSIAVFVATLAVVPLLLAAAVLEPHGWFNEPRYLFLPLIAMYGAMPNSFGRQILPPVLLTAGILVGRIVWFPGADRYAIGDTLLILSVNAIGIVMVQRRAELQRMVAVAFEELHTLRGIIPICAYCKKVRSEGEEWQQIEKYVHDRSAADFSHGICPDCMRNYFPDDTDRG
jgi:hypothetical protein